MLPCQNANIELVFEQADTNLTLTKLLAISAVLAAVGAAAGAVIGIHPALMPVTALTELHKLVPEEVYFTSVELDRDVNNRITLRGVANAVSDVVKFMSALEASPVFQDAKSTRTATVKGKTEFEIVCNVETRKP